MPKIITRPAENLVPHPAEDSRAAPTTENSESEHPLENVGIDSSAPDGEATNEEIGPMQT